MSRLTATLFGLGYMPFAAGTWGSLAALPFAWLLTWIGGPWLLGVGALSAFGIGVWACDRYVETTGKSDPSECIVDELAGQWIACLAVPLTLPGFAAAFLAFRLFDIWKPWPVSAAERPPGGLGVMLDDIVAGAMAAVLVAALHAVKLF